MAKKNKKVDNDYIPRMVILRARIEPAFRLVIEDDSTGKGWSGHTWYGDTGMDVLRRMKKSMTMGLYARDTVKIKTSTPARVAAVSWKEEVYE